VTQKRKNNMILFELLDQILFDDELEDILVLDFEVLKTFLIILVNDKLKILVQILDLILI
jgi:hypothetical protein